MSRNRGRKSLLRRTAAFEQFEERLVLSAHPLSGLLLSGVEPVASGGGESPPAPLPLLSAWSDGAQYARDQFGFRGGGQTVAVIDSGIAYDHVALGGGFGPDHRVVGGWDFTEENDADPYDDGPAGFHGTHVAGIIASDDQLRPGVAPDADLVALRVFNDMGSGQFDWVEEALRWVHDHRNSFEHPITTVNLSLGAGWNSDDPPPWAMLEDELEQLWEDGVFVAAAAGNSFESFGEPGLSYPAASPYVVPVASVGDSGQLSSFSQRNSRVLAAPGERIASTVPDYLFGGDGVPNDWATASGTSMASPYAAGASVLVREAMQWLGFADINQDAIYEDLYNTADVFYDSATSAYYHRINLAAALDSLMPADDYGSTQEDAYELGELAGERALSGVIGRLTDVDSFTFTAGWTGTVHLATEATGELVVGYQLAGGGGRLDGSSFSFDVAAGQRYTFSLSTLGGIGRYDLSLELTPAIVDWGVVDFQQFDGLDFSSGGGWFQLTASRSGLLTIEALFAQAGGDIRLELYDADHTLLAASDSASDSERVDVTAAKGDTFFLRVVGKNADVDVRLANLLSVSGGVAEVFGTAGDDLFTLAVADSAAGQPHVLTVNGVRYELAAADASELRFHGGEGQDSITIKGSAADETAVVNPGDVDFRSAAYRVRGDGMETVRVLGAGGRDTAILYDSAGDDRFSAGPDYAWMSADQFVACLDAFEIVRAYASRGGHDVAKLYDSSGDDRFFGLPEFSYVQGKGFFNYARGFSQVYAYSERGGHDVAKLYDSSGDDRFFGLPEFAYLQGEGFLNQARGFSQVYAHSERGGDDVAKLYDSSGDDRFFGLPEFAYLQGEGFLNQARGFSQVYAYSERGGHDLAKLYDSSGDDRFFGLSEFS